MTQRIVITGAAGGVGTLLRPRLARPGRVLRLVDIAPLPAAAPGEAVETVRADVTDADAMTAAFEGADAVVHMGGFSLEERWQDILDVNIHGTRQVYEGARRAGVRTVVFASSNHAVGYHPRDEGDPGDYTFPRPDTHYGVSKVVGEALASLYHDRYGINSVCIRIGSCFEKPKDARMMAIWLSPDDGARLVEAAIAHPAPGFRVVWGVSDNTRRWWPLDEARALGFEPRDDSEVFAAEIIARDGEPDMSAPPNTLIGGAFCSPDLDTDHLEERALRRARGEG